MEIPLKLKEDKKYLEILRILSNIKNPYEITPYNKLRNRELEVFAIMNYFFVEKYDSIPERERNTLIFSYDSRQEMLNILRDRGIDISKETVYNIMLDLRKKGLINSKSMVKKNIIPNVNKLNFKFI